jgi:acyl-CoA thioester hydrolase
LSTKVDSYPTWRTRVRVYECDGLGHVNNAVYLHYLQQATAEVWVAYGASAWVLRSLTIEYLAPAYSGDELAVRAWTGGVGDGSLVGNYNITRESDGRTLLRARAAWAGPGMEQSRPMPANPPDLSVPAPLRLQADRLNAHRYRWAHTVCAYELDGSGCANPVQLLRWVEEAKFVACSEVGWPLQRMFAADLMIVQIRHDSEFAIPVRAGEHVEVISRVCDLRLLKGTWCHEIYRLDVGPRSESGHRELVALDYSTGAFLTCAGKPNPAPNAVLDALVRGLAVDQDIRTPTTDR